MFLLKIVYHSFSIQRVRMMLINFAWNKSQYGFSLIRNFPYKDRILDSVLEENSGQRKPMFWHILRSVNPKISILLLWTSFTILSFISVSCSTDHSFSTYITSFKKTQTFLTSWYAHVRLINVCFLENFACVLTEYTVRFL